MLCNSYDRISHRLGMSKFAGSSAFPLAFVHIPKPEKDVKIAT